MVCGFVSLTSAQPSSSWLRNFKNPALCNLEYIHGLEGYMYWLTCLAGKNCLPTYLPRSMYVPRHLHSSPHTYMALRIHIVDPCRSSVNCPPQISERKERTRFRSSSICHLPWVASTYVDSLETSLHSGNSAETECIVAYSTLHISIDPRTTTLTIHLHVYRQRYACKVQNTAPRAIK
jgi:hypothetical protein